MWAGERIRQAQLAPARSQGCRKLIGSQVGGRFVVLRRAFSRAPGAGLLFFHGWGGCPWIPGPRAGRGVHRTGVLPPGGPRRRALLADLALNAGTIVSTARLIEDLWGDDPPPAAGHTVEAYISRIRGILRDGSAREVLLSKPPGYLLDVGRDRVDAFRFEELVEEGTGAAGRGDDSKASAVFRDALGLWRGDALADVCEMPFPRGAARRRADRGLVAVERRIECDLRLGRAQQLVAELEALAAAHPYHEPFHQQLMLALYRSGRQADALAAFRRARALLVGELGIEPG